MEEMDTSEPNWCWFYLAECGVWHMFEVVQVMTQLSNAHAPLLGLMYAVFATQSLQVQVSTKVNQCKSVNAQVHIKKVY